MVRLVERNLLNKRIKLQVVIKGKNKKMSGKIYQGSRLVAQTNDAPIYYIADSL